MLVIELSEGEGQRGEELFPAAGRRPQGQTWNMRPHGGGQTRRVCVCGQRQTQTQIFFRWSYAAASACEAADTCQTWSPNLAEYQHLFSIGGPELCICPPAFSIQPATVRYKHAVHMALVRTCVRLVSFFNAVEQREIAAVGCHLTLKLQPPFLSRLIKPASWMFV